MLQPRAVAGVDALSGAIGLIWFSTQLLSHEVDDVDGLVNQPRVILRCRRLGTHQAKTVAAVGQEYGVVRSQHETRGHKAVFGFRLVPL